jgi:hypothetical protein
VQFTQSLTHYHLKKIARKIYVSKTLDYFSHIHLNHHLPPPNASAAASDRLRQPGGVASARGWPASHPKSSWGGPPFVGFTMPRFKTRLKLS